MHLIFYLITTIFCRRDDSVIAVLCRNEDLEEMKNTMINFESKFNEKYNYPYVFLNDKDWTEDFKTQIQQTTKSSITFGKIEPKDWNPPKDLHLEKYFPKWKRMEEKGVPYASQTSYHNMCRFFSIKFFSHPLLMKYKYYWRIEPSIRFRCPINYDPFEMMEKNGYIYGFTISIMEFMETIPTLGDVTAKFISLHEDLIPNRIKPLEMFFGNGRYNGCHFWSNFEIASFDFFRGKLYTKYAEFLEKSGGFYKERWGDAPVHSLAVALFADKSKIHFFEDIGYTHPPFTHCPADNKGCDCTSSDSIDFQGQSCLKKYLDEKRDK